MYHPVSRHGRLIMARPCTRGGRASLPQRGALGIAEGLLHRRGLTSIRPVMCWLQGQMADTAVRLPSLTNAARNGRQSRYAHI